MKLYDVLELTDKEVIVRDRDFNIEDCFYGFKGREKPLDKWNKAEMELLS